MRQLRGPGCGGSFAHERAGRHDRYKNWHNIAAEINPLTKRLIADYGDLKALGFLSMTALLGLLMNNRGTMATAFEWPCRHRISKPTFSRGHGRRTCFQYRHQSFQHIRLRRAYSRSPLRRYESPCWTAAGASSVIAKYIDSSDRDCSPKDSRSFSSVPSNFSRPWLMMPTRSETSSAAESV